MRRTAVAAAVLLALGSAGLTACASPGSEPGTSPSATASPAEDAPVVATFQVHDETFRVELITPELIEHAQALLDGEDVSAIPLGTVVHDEGGVNEP